MVYPLKWAKERGEEQMSEYPHESIRPRWRLRLDILRGPLFTAASCKHKRPSADTLMVPIEGLLKSLSDYLPSISSSLSGLRAIKKG